MLVAHSQTLSSTTELWSCKIVDQCCSSALQLTTIADILEMIHFKHLQKENEITHILGCKSIFC